MSFDFVWWRAAGTALLLGLAGLCAHAEHIVLESYQEDEGLTNLTPRCLVQDAQATLWVCTENGLSRFDGFRMRAETLPKLAGGYLYGARVDSKGRLWVLAEGGVYVRQESEGAATWTEVLKPNGKRLHIQSSQQMAIDERGMLYAVDEDRSVWTAPTGSLGTSLVVQRTAMPALPALADQLPPLQLRAGTLWFGCELQLCGWRDGRIERWGPAQGLPEDGWGHLLVTRDGSLWARGRSHLARLAPNATEFVTVAAPLLGGIYQCDATIEDVQGGILTVTDRGIAKWDGKQWREWTHQEGLPETYVRVLMFDREGSLWLGANARGVHRWVGYGQVEHWTAGSGLPSGVVVDMARDGSGRLWITTDKGVAWFDTAARAFRSPSHPSPTTGVVYRLAVDAAGDLWWVEAGHVMSIKSGSLEPRVMARDSGLDAVSQGAGRVYANGNNGLELLEVSEGRLHRRPIGEGKFDPRYDIRILMDGNVERFVLNGRTLWTHLQGGWTRVQGSSGESVDAIEAVMLGATLWASGKYELATFALSGSGARELQALPKSAFGGATVATLRAGPDGRLWISTDQGVFIRATDGTWSRMDRRSGVIWNDTGGLLADPDGSVWLGSTGGVTRLLPNARPAPLPALRLEEVVFGSRARASLPAEPVPWGERFVRVTLGTAGFSRTRSMQIEYRLAADMPWRTTQRPVIDLGAMESGAHLLEVRAVGSAPVEMPGPVLRIPFEVRPPWWGSSEARAGFAAALLLLWWLSIRWLRRRDRARQRSLEAAVAERTAALAASEVALRRLGEHNAHALEEERLRVSRELHDELGQQLAAMRMEVSVAKVRASSDKSMDSSHLEMLLGRVDRLVTTVRGLVSQLRPPALDGGLAAALQWLAAEFTSSTKLPCEVRVDPGVRELPPPTATMVFRIAQESLTNVRRHAKAHSVELSLTRDGQAWVLNVSDDGIGFDPLTQKMGFGVLGMEERARLLGGSLEVRSAPGAGARVVLRIQPVASAV